MDSLPLELYPLIFEYLDLRDVLKLRLLSKEMNEIVQGYRPDELIINQRNLLYDFRLRDNWTFTNRPTKLRNWINCLMASFLCSGSLNLANLRRLRVANVRSVVKLSIANLNRLDRLSQLEIHYEKLQVNAKLHLVSLEILVIKSSVPIRMEIDCAKLHSLSFDYGTFEYVKLSHPQNVQRFLTNNYDRNVSRFPCLHYYECNTATNLSADLLNALPKLNELKINVHCSDDAATLRGLIERQKELNRELKIYHNGILLSAGELTRYAERSELGSRLAIQIASYGSLAECLPSEYSICYDTLLRTTRPLPADFHQKFNNLQLVEVKEAVLDPIDLMTFISACRNLYELMLFNSNLSQPFYDQLYKVSHLIILRIFENHENFRLNFGFVATMSYLEQLTTDAQFPEDQALVLNTLNRLKNFTFRVRRDPVHFHKLAGNHYQVKSVMVKDDLSLDDAVKQVNEWRELTDWANPVESVAIP